VEKNSVYLLERGAPGCYPKSQIITEDLEYAINIATEWLSNDLGWRFSGNPWWNRLDNTKDTSTGYLFTAAFCDSGREGKPSNVVTIQRVRIER
jgi:hypothetical protein